VDAPAVARRTVASTDPVEELARMREHVLELAGRGVSSEAICRETELSPGEVGLILKSLFRRE
jgi:hypothetical protein